MAVHKLVRVQGDTGEPINFTVTLDNQILNLTGYTCDFIMKSPTGLAANAGHTLCTIDAPSAGTCHYTFLANDLSEVGLYTCDLQLTSGALVVTEYAEYQITVRAQNG